jgi:hypothetical protein
MYCYLCCDFLSVSFFETEAITAHTKTQMASSEKCYFSWKPPIFCVPYRSACTFSCTFSSTFTILTLYLLAQYHKHVLSNYGLCTLLITPHPTDRAVKQVSACSCLSMFWESASVLVHDFSNDVFVNRILCFISNGREEIQNTCWWTVHTVSKQAVNSPRTWTKLVYQQCLKVWTGL